MSTPAISVVIPTYNRAEYVTKSIDSVLAQTCSDIEIIVVDDASTDDTRARVEAYGSRVRYLLTSGGGSAHARNVGMREARGKYLAFLDSDDLYYPYALELLRNVLDRHPEVAMVYSEMSGFDDAGFFERYHLKKYHESGYRDGLTYDRMFARSVSLDEAGVLPCALVEEDPQARSRRAYFGNIFDSYLTRLVLFTNSMLLRREVVPVVGERNEQVKYWEEMDYTLRITRHHTIAFVDVPTYRLRYHDGQISTMARSDGGYIWVRKQQILLRVLKRHTLADPDYYREHRTRLDAHLAGLHRAVAMPLMVFHSGPPDTLRRYTRAARKYLVRCQRLGHPEWALWVLSFAPGPLRRTGISVVEALRSRLRRLMKTAVPVRV